MKKVLLFAAAAAMILGSCSRQLVDESGTGTQSGNVSFDTYLYNPTKGAIKGGFVMGDQFKVVGAKTGPGIDFDVNNPSFSGWVFDGANFPDNSATVSNYGGAPNVWRYDNPVAWPADKVTFFGFSPVPVAGAGGETYGITYAAPASLRAIPSIDFLVKGGYDPALEINSADAAASRLLTKKQVDLLWVCAPNQTIANKTVNMMFQHALTRLSFAVRSNAPAGHFIRINSLVLKNAKVDGKLVLAHDESAGATPKPGDVDYLGGWTPGSTAKNFAVNLINNVASLIHDNDIHTLTDSDEALMMIPQSLAGVELEVRYAYSADQINWESYETGIEVKVKLDELTSHWNPNRQIRYVLNITPGEVIGFTADITPWGDEADVEFISVESGKDAQTVFTKTLAAGDEISVVSATNWITYAAGANAAADLSTTPVTATADNYTFAVKNNIAAARDNQIIINHANGKKTVIKVSQQAGNGTIKAPAGAGNVVTLSLAAGDKVACPATKVAATWVLGNGVVIGADGYTAGANEEYTLSVEANPGLARAATVVVTTGGTANTLTIEQAGIVTEPIALGAIGGKALSGVASDEITLISGGGAWFTITDAGSAASELSGKVTATGAYTLDAQINTTSSARTANFTVVTAGVTKLYELTQAAAATEVKAIEAIGGEVFAALTLEAGDYIEVVSDATAAFTDGTGASFSGKVATAGTYTVNAVMNTTATAQTATIIVSTAANGVKVYSVTVAAATVESKDIAAAGGEVLSGVTLVAGDYIEVVTGATANFTDGAGASFSGKVTTAGTYTVNAVMNIEATAKTAKIIVMTAADGLKIYNVTVAGATSQTIAQIALDGTSSEVVALVVGDKILAGTDVAWLTLTSPASTETYTGAAAVTVTDEGNWVVSASDNTTNAEVRSGSFTVVKADGTVVVYSVSQAQS